jgi:glycosyltransferase involved in cell wall biosynthesis
MENVSSYNPVSLSIIIPVYNEEEAVRGAIESNLNAVQNCLAEFEIIIINDGSKDNSQAVIHDFIKGKERIIFINKKENEGLGSAIRKGVDMATMDYILPVPVDCPLDAQTLKKFLSAIGNNDVVVGYRPRREGYSLRMKINSIVFHKLITYLFSINLIDYNWIHLYKSRIFTKDGIDISSNGILMLAEILIKSKRKGLLLKEIEIVQRERLTGVATASKLITVVKTIKEIILLYKKMGKR